MKYLFIFFSLVSFFTTHSMVQNVSPAAVTGTMSCMPELPSSRSINCSGMVYQYPTLDEVKNSPLGAAIADGNLAAVRLAFDGPSGWRRWICYWLLTDEKRQWVRAVHSLLYAAAHPEELTGSVAQYLWNKVKQGHLANGNNDSIAYDLFESKGACLILNACQNGHQQLLAELIKGADMQYGVCESLWHAAKRDNIALLRRLLEAGAQCEDALLSKVLAAGKNQAALWLIKQKVGLRGCDQQIGSALHVAIQKNSSLLPLLIQLLPAKEINCSIVYTVKDTDAARRIVHRTALDLIFDQEKPDEKIIEMLLKRGARCGLSASDERHALIRKYCEKFGVSVTSVCVTDTVAGKVAGCYSARLLGM